MNMSLIHSPDQSKLQVMLFPWSALLLLCLFYMAAGREAQQLPSCIWTCFIYAGQP